MNVYRCLELSKFGIKGSRSYWRSCPLLPGLDSPGNDSPGNDALNICTSNTNVPPGRPPLGFSP